jgi:hypothetical protein
MENIFKMYRGGGGEYSTYFKNFKIEWNHVSFSPWGGGGGIGGLDI